MNSVRRTLTWANLTLSLTCSLSVSWMGTSASESRYTKSPLGWKTRRKKADFVLSELFNGFQLLTVLSKLTTHQNASEKAHSSGMTSDPQPDQMSTQLPAKYWKLVDYRKTSVIFMNTDSIFPAYYTSYCKDKRMIHCICQ